MFESMLMGELDRLYRIVLLIALVTVPPSGLAAADSASSRDSQFRVLSIEDGDTLVVEMNGETRRIQLLGIDAPEDVPNPKLQRDQQRTGLDTDSLLGIGQAATRHLKSLIAPGQTVKLEGNLRKQDKYGRIPAIAYDHRGRSLNEAMVEDGYAVVLDRYPLQRGLRDRLKAMQQTAIAERRGLWGAHRAVAVAWSGQR